MNLLALDLGTRTGWATRIGSPIQSGVQVFDVKRGESPGMRYLRFNRWLDEMNRLSLGRSFGLIVYEQTHNRGGAATEVAAGFATRVQEFAAEHGIEHAAVHSATLKKFTTGKGNAKKPDMWRGMCAKGWHKQAIHAGQPVDDNEVDAICLLHYALAELVPAK